VLLRSIFDGGNQPIRDSGGGPPPSLTDRMREVVPAGKTEAPGNMRNNTSGLCLSCPTAQGQFRMSAATVTECETGPTRGLMTSFCGIVLVKGMLCDRFVIDAKLVLKTYGTILSQGQWVNVGTGRCGHRKASYINGTVLNVSRSADQR
jgi:hypothetical protein